MDPTRWDWTMFQRQGDEAGWLIEDVFGERRRGSSLSALLPVDMFSTDDDVVIQVDVPGIAADHIDLTLQADVVTIRIEPLPDRPAEYTQYLLQWLVTRARIVSPDGAPEALSRLVELERHLPVLAEHGLSTVDDLAGLADARLQNLADALSVSTDDLLRWRAEADERRRLGNISLVAYTINPTFIDFDVYEPVAASIQFDGRGMSVIFPPDSDVQHDSAECWTRGDPVDVRPGLPKKSFAVGDDEKTPLPKHWLKPGEENAWGLAPKATFPSYSFSVRSGGGFNVAVPVQGVPVALSLLGGDAAEGTITIADARTYGIDIMSLHEDVVHWARDRRPFLQKFGSEGDRRNYLRVVSRVYLAGTLNVSLQSTRNLGLTALGGAPKPVPLDNVVPTPGAAPGAVTMKAYKDNVSTLNTMIEEALKVVSAGTVGGAGQLIRGGPSRLSRRQRAPSPFGKRLPARSSLAI